MIVSGGADTVTGPSGNVLGRWIKAGTTEFRELKDGACDEADDNWEVESGGESKGGERKAGDVVSRSCTRIVGVVSLGEVTMGVMGRTISERLLDRRRGSVSVLALCCIFRC